MTIGDKDRGLQKKWVDDALEWVIPLTIVSMVFFLALVK